MDKLSLTNDIADLKSNHDAETSLAAMMARLVQSTQLRVWSVNNKGTTIEFVNYITITANSPSTRPTPRTTPKTSPPATNAQLHLRKCLETGTPIKLAVDTNGYTTEFFPGIGGDDIHYLLEIRRPSHLEREERVIINTLFQTFCSISTILDCNDRDELTSLFNNRSFSRHFNDFVAPINELSLAAQQPKSERRRKKYKSALAHLAVINFHSFDQITSQFGTTFSDEIRFQVGRLMTDCFRDDDRIFRLDNEIFAVLLANTDFQDAEIALERFRSRIEAFHIENCETLTFSIGFAKLIPGDHADTVLARANQALEVAKNAGPNEIQLYELLIAKGTLTPPSLNDPKTMVSSKT